MSAIIAWWAGPAKDGEEAQDNACLGHTNFELLRDVEREEREEHGATDAVDEHDADHQPEAGREFAVDLLETVEHGFLSLRETQL